MNHAANFMINQDYGKIQCIFTNHELNPDNEKEFDNFVKTNKSYRASLMDEGFDFENFCKFIIPHKSEPKKKMFCTITRNNINRTKNDILLHRNGKDYCKSIFEAWRERMLKTRKKLIF